MRVETTISEDLTTPSVCAEVKSLDNADTSLTKFDLLLEVLVACKLKEAVSHSELVIWGEKERLLSEAFRQPKSLLRSVLKDTIFTHTPHHDHILVSLILSDDLFEDQIQCLVVSQLDVLMDVRGVESLDVFDQVPYLLFFARQSDFIDRFNTAYVSLLVEQRNLCFSKSRWFLSK